VGQRITKETELFSAGFLAWVSGVTPQAMRLYLAARDVRPDVLIHGDNGRVTGAYYESTVRRILQQRIDAGLSTTAKARKRLAAKPDGRGT
jgi:hypothetical protein